MARFYIAICLLSTMALGQENARAVSLVGGLYVFRSDWGSSWVPLSAVQLTYSSSTGSIVRIDWNAEYYRHKYAWPTGLFVGQTKAGLRHDLALYPSAVFLDLFQVGVGLYYSRHGQVVRQYPYLSSPTVSGPMSLIRMFYQLALIPTIRVTDRLGLRLGLSYRNQDLDDNTFPIAVRAGVSFSF